MSMKYEHGRKLSPADAKKTVDELYGRARRRWDEKVMNGGFMTALGKGELPMPVIREFFRNWGSFTIEVNTLIACTYQRHLPFLRENPDLMGPVGEKIADEFIHPRPPGHKLVMLQTAKALGLTEEEILTCRMLPLCRGKLDFYRMLIYEGTVAEFWSAVSGEEMIGIWSAAWFEALTKRYKLSADQAIYFSTHHEADLHEHEEGVMGHGELNRVVLQRLFERGEVVERVGYGIEYSAFTIVDLHAAMQDAAWAAARGN